jgi:hypothetical protein
MFEEFSCHRVIAEEFPPSISPSNFSFCNHVFVLIISVHQLRVDRSYSGRRVCADAIINITMYDRTM